MAPSHVNLSDALFTRCLNGKSHADCSEHRHMNQKWRVILFSFFLLASTTILGYSFSLILSTHSWLDMIVFILLLESLTRIRFFFWWRAGMRLGGQSVGWLRVFWEIMCTAEDLPMRGMTECWRHEDLWNTHRSTFLSYLTLFSQPQILWRKTSSFTRKFISAESSGTCSLLVRFSPGSMLHTKYHWSHVLQWPS